jgi:hypothetical protein
MPTPLSEAEGNMTQDANRKPCVDPARLETLCMSGSFLYRSWEISSVPEPQGTRAGQGRLQAVILSLTQVRSRIRPYDLRSRRTRG